MIVRKKAAELHKRYMSLEYPIDIEDVARNEGLKVINWPLLPPMEEVKRGKWVGIRDGLSSEQRRWDIAHVTRVNLLG